MFYMHINVYMVIQQENKSNVLKSTAIQKNRHNIFKIPNDDIHSTPSYATLVLNTRILRTSIKVFIIFFYSDRKPVFHCQIILMGLGMDDEL